MTLKIHISSHNDDLHNSTAKRNLANGVVGLNSISKIENVHLTLPFLTIPLFQINAATGTALDPQASNDGLTGGDVVIFDLNEYIEVNFIHEYLIKEFRSYGIHGHSLDGEFTIQYLNMQGNWIDLMTFPTVKAVWSSWIALPHMIHTQKIRIKATTIDSAGSNFFYEIELRG